MTIYSEGLSYEDSSIDGTKIFSIVSTEAEHKKIERIVITDVVSNPVILEVHVEREDVVKNLRLEVIADATPERVIELGVELPVGKTLNVVIKDVSAGSHGKVVGWVEWTMIA